MAKLIDLYCDQGADFIAVLPPVTTPTGATQNLTGYTVVSQIRRGYASSNAIELTAEVSNATAGIITLSLPSSQTCGLSPVRYLYNVLISDSNNSDFTTKVFEGLVVVNPGVSGKPNTTLVTPYIPDDYGGL